MKQKTIYFQVILAVILLCACSTRRIFIHGKSFWDDSRYVFHRGDSLLVVQLGEKDHYPACDDSKNNLDSLKHISFRYIDSIEKNYFSSFSKCYEYDSLSGYDLNELRKTEKKIQENFESFQLYSRTWRYKFLY